MAPVSLVDPYLTVLSALLAKRSFPMSKTVSRLSSIYLRLLTRVHWSGIAIWPLCGDGVYALSTSDSLSDSSRKNDLRVDYFMLPF